MVQIEHFLRVESTCSTSMYKKYFAHFGSTLKYMSTGPPLELVKGKEAEGRSHGSTDRPSAPHSAGLRASDSLSWFSTGSNFAPLNTSDGAARMD